VPISLGPITTSSANHLERFTEPGSAGGDAPHGAGAVSGGPAIGDFASLLKCPTAKRVEATRTPLSSTEASDAIARAFESLTGIPLDGPAKSILTAQWAHETGHGASMYNFNFGGIKGVGPSGLTVSQRTKEGYGANEHRITDQFRAYNTIEEGATDYAKLLLTRYGDAVNAARAGDPQGFVRGLRQKGYFTGDPTAYERSITTIANQLSQYGPDNLAPQSVGKSPRNVFQSEHLASAQPIHVQDRALWSQLQGTMALMVPPQPAALLQAGDERANASLADDFGGISAVRALSMADEIARSTIELARVDADRDKTGPVATRRSG